MALNKEEEKILKITVRYDDALEGIKKYKKEIQELKEAEKELTKESEDYDEELELINAKRKEAEASIRVLRKEIQNNIKIEKQQEGSLKQLRAALSNATKEYDEMSKAERESAKGVELKNHINDITKELKGAEEETQRFYRNVGNYKNSILEAIGVNGGFADSLMSMAENGKGVKGFFTNAISSVKAFGTALLGLLANPVFLAIAGIAGAGIAFKWFYDYNKGLIEATRLTKQFNEELSGDELKEHRNVIQAIADMYGKDFKEVLIASNTLVTQFGISAQEATTLLADGFALGADVTGDWLDRIKEYSTFFKDAGVSASEFIAISVEASKNGAFGDKALDAIKEATLRLREMPTATQEALSGIGLSSEAIQQGLSDGTYTMMEVIKMVSDKLGGLEPTSKEVGTAIADIFRGAGEDAGTQYLQTIGQISTDLGKLKKQSVGYYEMQNEVLLSEVEVKNALSDIFDTTGGQFERMEANAKIFINDVIVTILGYVKDTVTYFQDLYRESEAFRGIIVTIGRVFSAVFVMIGESINRIVDNFRFLGEIMEGVFTGNWDKVAQGFDNYINKAKDGILKVKDAWANVFSEIPKIAEEEMLKSTNNSNNNNNNGGGGGGGGGGNKSPLEKEIEKEYQTRQDQIEKEAELIRKRLELVKYEAEERYRIKMELLEKEKQLEIMRITEEYTNEVQRNEALRLLDLEYAQKAQELEKEKSDVLLNEVIARSQAMMDAVTKQKEHEKRTAEEEKRIQETKANAIVKITGALSDVLANASDNNEALAKVAKALAIAEILISQGVAIAKAVEAATKSGGSWWTVAATIATAVATVTATMSSAMKSVNSAKVGGGGSAGGSSASSMTYTSSAMFNPMLAQLNSVGDNMMPYESRMRDESMNEEMMTDAVTRGVLSQPAPVVSVVEITETQNRVKAIESMGDV